MEPVLFISRAKPPSLLKIWIPVVVLSIYFFIVSWIVAKTLIIVVVFAVLFLPFYLTIKHQIKIVISTEEKTFQYYYMNCWGKERVVIIDIPTTEGSYKYIKISQAKWGWQLVLYYNDKRNKLTVSQGGFKKFQLDQMVRMINQIKKGVFVSDVGSEF